MTYHNAKLAKCIPGRIQSINDKDRRPECYASELCGRRGLFVVLKTFLSARYFSHGKLSSVSRQKGLFYFDSSFRPIPLEQHFLGIKGKSGSPLSRKNLDRVTFQKVSELVAQGHQVMVFVHARKETVKTAMGLREMSIFEGNSEDFSCEEHPQWNFFRRDIGESRNREMKQLFDSGFGIHHAGMLRSDRNMMERMFDARAIKVIIQKHPHN